MCYIDRLSVHVSRVQCCSVLYCGVQHYQTCTERENIVCVCVCLCETVFYCCHFNVFTLSLNARVCLYYGTLHQHLSCYICRVFTFFCCWLFVCVAAVRILVLEALSCEADGDVTALSCAIHQGCPGPAQLLPCTAV